MRYEVGQDYAFVEIEFTDKDGNETFTQTYLPWEHRLIHLAVRRLGCVSHHRVRLEFERTNTEPRFHGYVFEEHRAASPDEKVWYNQYPVARFSQISTESDHIVQQRDLTQMVDALHLMGRLRRGLWQLERPDAPAVYGLAEDVLLRRRVEMANHLLAVRLIIEQVMQRPVVFQPTKIGGKEIAGFFSACLD